MLYSDCTECLLAAVASKTATAAAAVAVVRVDIQHAHIQPTLICGDV